MDNLERPPVIKTLRHVRYQIIPLIIAAPGNTKEESSINTDVNYGEVDGIQVTYSDSTAHLNSTFDQFKIGEKEIYPKGYETRNCSAGLETGVNDRYDEEIKEPALGSTISIIMRDGGNATAYPYTAFVYLRLKNPTK